MAKVPGLDTILNAADLISDVRRVFAKIENLESGQKQLADELSLLADRVRELEAGLREAKAEIKLDAHKQAQSIVNAAQSQLYNDIKNLTLQVDRLERGAFIESRNMEPDNLIASAHKGK